MNNEQSSRQFLLEVAARLKMTSEAIEPLIKQLEDDWFDTKASLKKITDDIWEEYSITKDLLMEIKISLENTHGKKAELHTNLVSGSIYHMEEAIASINSEEKMEELIGPIQSEEDKLKNALTEVREGVKNIEELKETFTMLHMIIKNIVNSPTNLKIRKLRLENLAFYKSIGKHQSAMAFLLNVNSVITNSSVLRILVKKLY